MIFLAEFGDKTQIAIAGLGSTANATATWAGATLALACTSILGVRRTAPPPSPALALDSTNQRCILPVAGAARRAASHQHHLIFGLISRLTVEHLKNRLRLSGGAVRGRVEG
jgi:hypothetical protein